MGGVVQGEFAQGEGGGRRPGGGAADAGEARISRPEGGLACGPTLPPAETCICNCAVGVVQ